MSQDDVKTKASPRTPRTPDEVRTKISGSGPDRNDKAPESVSPDSVQATADASGARLLIPALSLREAIANIDSAQDPVASLAAELERESQEIALAKQVGEPTETVQKPRRWYKSSLAVWLTAGALVGLGFLASTTEAAESVAGRIYTMFQNEEAIPAAAADTTPSAEPSAATAPMVANVAAVTPEPSTPAAQAPAVAPAAKAPAKVAPKGPQPLRTRPVTR